MKDERGCLWLVLVAIMLCLAELLMRTADIMSTLGM